MSAVGVCGLGMTGAHAARLLSSRVRPGGLAPVVVELFDSDAARLTYVRSLLDRSGSLAKPVAASALTTAASTFADVEVVVLATPADLHVEQAASLVAQGISVVSLSDDCDVVEGLLELSGAAQEQGVSVAVGAGFAPGLTCLLTRLAGDSLDVVEEIAVSKSGTGGPACARQHHRALKSDGLDWIDNDWVVRRGGSGRDLAWFPGQIGARDCYRGAFPSPRLLQRKFPNASRISARVSATRRDRLTSRLPMLRPPHPDGGPGAVRVEVRGFRAGAYETRVYGAMEHPSLAAGTVAAVVAMRVLDGSTPAGAFGLAELDDAQATILTLRQHGLVVSRFGGTSGN